MKSPKSPLLKTHNGLPEKTRQQSVDLLNQNLTDMLDLFLQSKQAHWNVRGPFFIGLHLLFDEVAEGIEELTDEVAERIVALGGTAVGTSDVIAKGSRLAKYPLDIYSGKDHVKALSAALGSYSKTLYGAIEKATEFGDPDTADLCTEVSRAIDKLLWKVESHLMAKE